jgi:hypothetical protein
MNSSPEGTPGASPEPPLEQRLEALEHALQRLTEATGWRDLLDTHVPVGERIAVLADPAILPFEALGRPVVGLLPEAGGGAAGIARLVAQSAQGVRFVLVPEVARSELQQDAHLVEHLHAHFRVVAADPSLGAVFQASPQARGDLGQSALADMIDRVCVGDRHAPILDWTSLGMSALLPGRTLFRPVEPDAEALPYVDHTIDVVLVDDAERMDEAARVAATPVLVTIDDAGRVTGAQTRHTLVQPGPPPAPVLTLVPADTSDEWLGRLIEAFAGRPGVEVRATADMLATAVESDAPILVLAEGGVLPLPQCIEAAERILAIDPQVGGVAVKLFGADGSLEAAGAAAFADGSLAPIAREAPAAAPWHDYARPVAAAYGLVVLRSAAARQCIAGDPAEGFDLAGVSARLWSSGWELRYQPDAAAVRVLEPAAQVAEWPAAPAGLPARPPELDDAAWRHLLAKDRVGAVG